MRPAAVARLAVPLLAPVLAVGLLGGCSGTDPAAALQVRADAVVRAADAGDAAAYAEALDALSGTVAAQRAAGDLPAAPAGRLLAVVAALRAQTSEVDPRQRAARQAAGAAAARASASAAAAAASPTARPAPAPRAPARPGKDGGKEDGGKHGGGKGDRH